MNGDLKALQHVKRCFVFSSIEGFPFNWHLTTFITNLITETQLTMSGQQVKLWYRTKFGQAFITLYSVAN